ncbi:MAG: hypothetical protein J5509_01595 [Lachnospiraceae bacterium]|nr:hypothetical protein [Lachnospiraceae bacterium]
MKNKQLKKILAILCATLILTGCGASKTRETSREDFIPVIPYSETLSADEEKADALLKEMKQEADALYTFGTPYAVPEWSDDAYADTKLYSFCRMLPKGGDLHGHDDTMISYTRFIDVIRDRAEICLEEGDQYGYMYAYDNPDKPEGCVPIGEALDNGTLTEEELTAFLTLAGKEDQRGWDVLHARFAATSGVHTNEEIYKDLYEETFRNCVDNGVILAELRVLASPDDDVTVQRLTNIREAYYRVRQDHPEFRVRVICTASKNLKYDEDQAGLILDTAIRASSLVKDEFDPAKPEEFVIGLDLVSEEDTSRPLKEYTEYLTSEEVKNSGLKLFLHCGESLLNTNDTVIDAYTLGAVRAGHAFNLYRYPELMEKYAEDKVAIEVCPISNYRLDYVSDLRLHPALSYLRNGIPVCICSDDGVYLSTEPLVDDFYAAILSWDLSIGDIKAICRNSITYSGLPKEETDELMKTWEAQWDEFIADIAG